MLIPWSPMSHVHGATWNAHGAPWCPRQCLWCPIENPWCPWITLGVPWKIFVREIPVNNSLCASSICKILNTSGGLDRILYTTYWLPDRVVTWSGFFFSFAGQA